MTSKVTIVMYHYVRDLLNSRFPDIKGLDIRLFEEQIAYLMKYYNFITMEQLIDSIDNDYTLPEKAVLLTFDDAYIDHYTHVFPVLMENGIQGSFYSPVKAITEHKVLDVNKIHYILASVVNKETIVKDLFALLGLYRKEYDLKSNEYYYSKLAKSNRFDSKDVIFIKRLLQMELDESLRNILVDSLFEKYIGMPEDMFSRELYMSIDQIKLMRKAGMHIGSHGYDHYWLNSLSKEKQESEIKKSLSFIKTIGGDLSKWTMCYPYGAYNNETIDILCKYNCKLGLTTDVNVAEVNGSNRYEMSRLDTNDIPKDRNSEVNEWFKLA